MFSQVSVCSRGGYVSVVPVVFLRGDWWSQVLSGGRVSLVPGPFRGYLGGRASGGRLYGSGVWYLGGYGIQGG